jgi:ubiquinone/menaquinone biosynthesis C-methylase UbiE
MIIYGLMKFIEQIPERYDKMIGWLTLGGHLPARRLMLERVTPGTRVLDIGCGTGSFLLEAAERGGVCVGVDAALPMLRVFRRKLAENPLAERITVHHRSATLLSNVLEGQTFDLITCSLVLGELPPIVLASVLRQIPGLLTPSGTLFICDELWPEEKWRQLIYAAIFGMTFVPNFILTRTVIRPVKGLPEQLAAAGLPVRARHDFTGRVVTLLEAGHSAA